MKCIWWTDCLTIDSEGNEHYRYGYEPDWFFRKRILREKKGLGIYKVLIPYLKFINEIKSRKHLKGWAERTGTKVKWYHTNSVIRNNVKKHLKEE